MGLSRIAKRVMYLPLGLSGSAGQRLLGEVHLTAHYTGQTVSQLQQLHMPLAYGTE